MPFKLYIGQKKILFFSQNYWLTPGIGAKQIDISSQKSPFTNPLKSKPLRSPALKMNRYDLYFMEIICCLSFGKKSSFMKKVRGKQLVIMHF